jgi:tetratricopeptide (TPR) repeat protein
MNPAEVRDRAEAERRQGNLAAAQQHYEEAVALYRLALAHTIRHLGDVHRKRGNWEAAEPCYREALEIYRANRDHASPLDVANAIRPYALLQEHNGNRAQGRAMWEEAQALYESQGIDAGVEEASRWIELLQ